MGCIYVYILILSSVPFSGFRMFKAKSLSDFFAKQVGVPWPRFLAGGFLSHGATPKSSNFFGDVRLKKHIHLLGYPTF